MPAAIQIVPGEKYGRLTIIKEAERTGSRRMVLCQCECGNHKITGLKSLRSGGTRSCGCLKRECDIAKCFRHGESARDGRMTPEYHTWMSMRARCNNTNAPEFENYGGRGISVCERWNDFSAFLNDMGRRPTPRHTIDRIDNDGNYEPGNCRWATSTEQVRNRRVTLTVEYNGETVPLAELAEKHGLSYKIVLTRYKTWGWPIERALHTPSMRTSIEFNGDTDTLSGWARRYGLRQTTLRERIQRGWSMQQALTTPVDTAKGRRSSE